MTRVKICCISSIEEALSAIDCGASALGLVSEMPSGPGVISEDLISEISNIIPPSVSSFLLTSKQNIQEIIDQQKKCKTNTIQICDRITKGSYKNLREALPGIKIVQVIHITSECSIGEAIETSHQVDGILLDSGNQNLEVKELGGTGKVHNWSISRRIVESVNVPVFLAGGLYSENITEAIYKVRPFGVDVCSGVRTNGKLDNEKLIHFFKKIREADF
ncbi:MAG: phosphoribosylanthranilate isomerase [Ignavibacteria bacterium]|nr:phosphoribosylanthranilate isomerase [Ignavibacteria bacterium]